MSIFGRFGKRSGQQDELAVLNVNSGSEIDCAFLPFTFYPHFDYIFTSLHSLHSSQIGYDSSQVGHYLLYVVADTRLTSPSEKKVGNRRNQELKMLCGQ